MAERSALRKGRANQISDPETRAFVDSFEARGDQFRGQVKQLAQASRLTTEVRP